jgi:hypothetical protein
MNYIINFLDWLHETFPIENTIITFLDWVQTWLWRYHHHLFTTNDFFNDCITVQGWLTVLVVGLSFYELYIVFLKPRK